MTQQQYIINRKVNIVELAQTLGNISEACRNLGVSRQHYYDIGFVEALIRSTADSFSKSYYQIKGMLPIEGGEIQEAVRKPKTKT